MVKGKRRQFSTGEVAVAKATDKARAILADLKARGLSEAIALHSRRLDELPADPSIEEFSDLYRKTVARTEFPPARQTQERYLKDFSIIAAALRVSRLRSITPDKIKCFISDYQADALAQGREAASVKVSLNSILRNASALFSKAALVGFAERGLTIANPFAGLKIRRVNIPGFTPLKPEVLRTIWTNAAFLRDGDPTAPAPDRHSNRWGEPDWRKPHPEAYQLLLLELGLGLRRHEADKAEWDWVFADAQGRTYIEVKPTAYFTPKSRERRVIPLAKPLHDALLAFRTEGPFIVSGRKPKAWMDYAPGRSPKNLVYRCDMHHRILAWWLRHQGVADRKPCHLLRKQFGSYVATAFGLYHAQKFLGHSSPKVTSDYYAGLVELPEINHVNVPPAKNIR
jgi:integrase